MRKTKKAINIQVEAVSKQRHRQETPAGHGPTCVTCRKTCYVTVKSSPLKKAVRCSRNIWEKVFFFVEMKFTKLYGSRIPVNRLQDV